MKFRLEPMVFAGCDCEYCKAGLHLYFLYRIPAPEGRWSAFSLQPYRSVEEAKQHYWGINFGPDPTWEDGTPVVQPQCEPRSPEESKPVPLDRGSFATAADLLGQHFAEAAE
jgi:hypothetical protein